MLLLLLLLFIIFKSLVLSNLLNDACVSKIMLGFLTIVPQFDDTVLLLHCNTDVSGVDVTKIGAVTVLASVFETLIGVAGAAVAAVAAALLLLRLMTLLLLQLLFFTLAKTNWFEWFCGVPLAFDRPLS